MTDISIADNVLSESAQQAVYAYLSEPGWVHGWRSDAGSKAGYTFFHKHFAGNVRPDNYGADQYECESELLATASPIAAMWVALRDNILSGHRLVRCYANGLPFGCDGTVHTDSVSPNSYTAIYYPHPMWHPDWAGETVFFNPDRSDVIAACYPKPNRLLVFAGTHPHCGRGVSRACPMMRVTLMFKTEKL